MSDDPRNRWLYSIAGDAGHAPAVRRGNVHRHRLHVPLGDPLTVLGR